MENNNGLCTITNNIYNPHKFSPNEIFSSVNGKTSGSIFIGFVTSMVCLLIFVTLTVYYFINPCECANILLFIDKTITFFSLSIGLMGIKSVTSAFGKQRIEISQYPINLNNNQLQVNSCNNE